jgi:alpha-ketoglutaric semialdehyde dehydrogenase
MSDIGNLIDGKQVGAQSGAWIERPTAPDGISRLSRVPRSAQADVQAAVAGARTAFAHWSGRSAFERADHLRRLASEIRNRSDDFAELMCREVGKTLADGHAEVANAARVVDFYAGLAHELGGTHLPSARGGVHLYTRREPVGVVALITPWNFPVNLPLVKMAPALLAGNTVVWKPASQGAESAALLAECFVAADLPAGVVNMVLGEGREVGEPLVKADVDAVSFTGSTPVGRRLEQLAAERGTRILVELGGKNATIVCSDADLDLAARTVAAAAFGFAGQKCTATSRVIVIDAVHEEFVGRLSTIVAGMVVGDPHDARTEVGPLISDSAREWAQDRVESAVSAGAKVVTNSAGIDEPRAGSYMSPVVITGVTPRMAVAREELFAPVLAVLHASDLAEAFEIADDTEFGLTAAIFTTDLAAAFSYAHRADAGAVMVNLPTAGMEFQSPLGGRRGSGGGGLEQGLEALHFYTEVKTIAIRYGTAG